MVAAAQRRESTRCGRRRAEVALVAGRDVAGYPYASGATSTNTATPRAMALLAIVVAVVADRLVDEAVVRVVTRDKVRVRPPRGGVAADVEGWLDRRG